ncbi:MAG: ADP-ribosyltransferase [Methanocorpusculum sp.]|nr:ADP-ribosyltransferase [Methanocorpusculum sp.]
MQNNINEPVIDYSIHTQPPHAPYNLRADLTGCEAEALYSYQDFGLPQHDWRCFSGDEEMHKDCYVINRALRDSDFYNSMCEDDKYLYHQLRKCLDSAICKTVINNEMALIKGLKNPDWILNKQLGDIFTDDAYGSFSMTPEVALRYSGYNSELEKVFMQVTIPKGTKAVYMGKKEDEILLFRGAHYKIDEIVHSPKGSFLAEEKALVYIVVMI